MEHWVYGICYLAQIGDLAWLAQGLRTDVDEGQIP